METKVYKARRASGMTLEACADMLGMSVPTYLDREKNPGKLTFGQVFAMAAGFDADALGILAGAVDDVEAGARGWKPLRELTLEEFFGARNAMHQLEMELAASKKRVFAQGQPGSRRGR